MIDKDTIIRLAREVWGDLPIDMASAIEIDRLERLAQAAYKQGLEDAAKCAEEWPTDWAHALDVGAKIRALKGEA